MLPFPAPSFQPPLTASIVVHVTHPTGKVNPWIFGTNLIAYQHHGPRVSNEGDGVWDPIRRRSVPQMTELEKRAGVTVARWPGGCEAHTFEWKKTVGPLAKRPNQQWGLPEFLQHCKDIGAEPLITVSDYTGTAQDAADLVEYLNAPNDGRHPWAALRASDGHNRPWHVTWFEYGNESEHGLHYTQGDFGKYRKFTPQEYAYNYLAYRKAMRAVDPHIRLGAVLATGFPDLNVWAKPVLQIIGPALDFAIHHCYKVGYYANDGNPDASTLFRIALTAPDQIQDFYNHFNRLIREATGRPDTPVAVTEYNGHFVQERPVPYRHTLGNALLNAEMIRVFLQPQNHITMACFWEFPNEYWGAVKGYALNGEPLVRRPQYYPFELYHEHFGKELVACDVDCPTYESPGGFGLLPAKGAGTEERMLDEVKLDGPWAVTPVPGLSQTVQGDTLRVQFQAGTDVNYYHAAKTLPAASGSSYRVSAWIKTKGLSSSNGACIQVGDARGWPATHSAAVSPSITGTREWTRVQVDYHPLPDTKEIQVLARRLGGAGPVTGTAWFRDVRAIRFQPRTFPHVPYLDVAAARTIRGRKGRVTLMIVNRNLEVEVQAVIRVPGFRVRSAQMWTLAGPSVDATNEVQPDTVALRHQRAPASGDVVHLTFLPATLNAVELEGELK
ncbi:MAG: alpha-L-arabinofuranosidase C-terminal domain-containing protein [Chthonomonadales bacterium]